MQRRGLRRGVQNWAMLPHCKPDHRLKHFEAASDAVAACELSRVSHPLARRKAGISGHMQVELHTLARVDQGGSGHLEALPHEVWCGEVGTDPGDRAAAGEAHPAAKRPGAAPARPAVPCRCFAASDFSPFFRCHLQPSREQPLTCKVASRLRVGMLHQMDALKVAV